MLLQLCNRHHHGASFSAEQKCCIEPLSEVGWGEHHPQKEAYSQACRSEELQNLSVHPAGLNTNEADFFVFASAGTMFPDQSDFDYGKIILSHTIQALCLITRPVYFSTEWVLFSVDYDTLRTTGVILAVVMSVSGILIALSKLKLSTRNHLNKAAFSTRHLATNLSFLKQVKNVPNV